MPTNLDIAAQTIWDYHHVHHALKPAGIILVLGSHDLRVPEYAAKLYHDSLAPLIVISGGVAHQGDMLQTTWEGTEAEQFAKVMIENGVPSEKILLENAAKNTGENFSLSRKLLDERGINFIAAIAVTKPYMERRAFATGAKQWPDKELIITSPQLSFEAYCNAKFPKDDVINIMMGDLQRIDVYGKNGFQSPQEIPAEVWSAFELLKAASYTKHLLKTP